MALRADCCPSLVSLSLPMSGPPPGLGFFLSLGYSFSSAILVRAGLKGAFGFSGVVNLSAHSEHVSIGVPQVIRLEKQQMLEIRICPEFRRLDRRDRQ